MWIAAIARQHDLTLLTQDAHFSNVDGLNVQGW
jgi:predicted nucleic acid-binding protein